MPHILIIPAWYPDRSKELKGVFFRDQALALAGHGHDVGVVSVNLRSLRTIGRKALGKPGASYEIDEGIPTYRKRIWAALPQVPYGNYILWRRAAGMLFRQYVQDHGCPDLIHAHCALYAGAVAGELGRKFTLPVVLTEHNSAYGRELCQPWQLRLANEASTRASKCIAVSPKLGHLLADQLPASKARWIWVPNAVGSRFNKSLMADRTQCRPFRFLNLALMNPNKGQMDLLAAFARAFGNDSDSEELWMGGDGPMLTNLQRRAQELGIAQRVRFLGRIPPGEVPSLLEEVDAMVIASHYETFGVVAAEALMAGLPVVSTRCGGPECIVGEGDGHLVPLRDPAAMAEALRELAAEPREIDRHGIAERARQRFSGEAVASQLSRIYAQILSDWTSVPDRT